MRHNSRERDKLERGFAKLAGPAEALRQQIATLRDHPRNMCSGRRSMTPMEVPAATCKDVHVRFDTLMCGESDWRLRNHPHEIRTLTEAEWGVWDQTYDNVTSFLKRLKTVAGCDIYTSFSLLSAYGIRLAVGSFRNQLAKNGQQFTIRSGQSADYCLGGDGSSWRWCHAFL